MPSFTPSLFSSYWLFFSWCCYSFFLTTLTVSLYWSTAVNQPFDVPSDRTSNSSSPRVRTGPPPDTMGTAETTKAPPLCFRHASRATRRSCAKWNRLRPTSDEATLEAMVKSGMDVGRRNFSHGDYEGHRELLDRVRKLSSKYGDQVPGQHIVRHPGPEDPDGQDGEAV